MWIQLIGVLAFGLAAPLWAKHGLLSTTDRDAWIDQRFQDLVNGGLVSNPGRPLNELTNLQVAQLTAEAAHTVLAQADVLPPPTLDGMPPSIPGDLPAPSPALAPEQQSSQVSKGLKDLVEEFKNELSAMDVDVARLEDKIYDQKRRNENFAARQQEYLRLTGTTPYGDGAVFSNLYRGFGANSSYPSMDYNDFMYLDFGFKGVPAPFVLFDAQLRITRTIGLYYVDPITPPITLRWLSLTNFNELATITVGDFYKSYTPLTLWNNDVPVYTFIEPTSFQRNRKAVEDLVYMDHEPDWHLRGFQASSSMAWPDNVFLSYFKLHMMAGELKSATQASFSNYFAASQASLSFFNDNLEFKGVGLLLWNDPNTVSIPYIVDFPSTFAKQYQIGSLSARLNIPFADKVSLSGSLEGAFNQYQDDINNPLRVFQDWAVLGNASLNISGVHLTTKYYNVGPYFYSPGAQTNHYSAVPGQQGYIGTNLFLDDALPGYLDNYVFQKVDRPVFAGYDRMAENMLPYGDATPNRLGMVFGFSADIGKNGWLKPQASWIAPISTLQMHEIQAVDVLNPAGTGAVAVDAATNTQTGRTFGGYEGALTIDLAKAMDLKDKTYQVSFDYKNQTTDLGIGAALFTVNTFIASWDFCPPIKGFDSLVFSVGFESINSSGSEYVLNGVGSPSTYANYSFYLDTGSLGSYAYTPLNISKTVWAFGAMYPLTPAIRFRGDLFLNQYTYTDVPGYDRHDEIGRIACEASF